MKRIVKALFIILLVFSLASCSMVGKNESIKAIQLGNAPTSHKAKYKILKESQKRLGTDFGKGLEDYSLKLAKRLLNEEDKENLAFSPLSLHYALSILANGCEKETKTQLMDFLCQTNIDTLNQNNYDLMSFSAMNNKNGIFDTNNSLWLEEKAGNEINKEFLDVSEKFYLAPVFKVDFKNPNTAKDMTKWVSDMTNKMIQPKFEFKDNHLLTILNTLYFESEWEETFDKKNTKKMDFTKADLTKVKKDFMIMTEESKDFYKGEKFSKAKKSFKNGIDIIFILPNKGENIKKLVKDEKVLGQIINSDLNETGKISWFVPKFKVKSEIDLTEHLNQSGVTNIFNAEKADFSKLTKISNLYVSILKQISAIEIDEQGGKAASMTQIDMDLKSAPPVEDKILEMKLDRPFLYILSGPAHFENVDRNIPIMMGIVGNPEY